MIDAWPQKPSLLDGPYSIDNSLTSYIYIYIHIYMDQNPSYLKIVDIMCGPTINHILNIITTLVSNVIAHVSV